MSLLKGQNRMNHKERCCYTSSELSVEIQRTVKIALRLTVHYSIEFCFATHRYDTLSENLSTLKRRVEQLYPFAQRETLFPPGTRLTPCLLTWPGKSVLLVLGELIALVIWSSSGTDMAYQLKVQYVKVLQ